jgi:SAM-dependent methyltransferase
MIAHFRNPSDPHAQILLCGRGREARILEIGAGYNPTVTRADGWNVRYLDHTDKAGLIAKYTDSQPTDRMEEVDYVWSGEPYIDLVGEDRFDLIIASHVIEHQPDLIGWLNDCAAILALGGVLSLAVPDIRCMFDYYRMPSNMARILDAHLMKRTRPSPGDVIEHYLMYSRMFDRITWDRSFIDHPQFFEHMPLADLMNLARESEQGTYHDVHVWTFTPAHFRLILFDLNSIGMISLAETGFDPRASTDDQFFIRLVAGPARGNRRTLAVMAKRELAGYA